MSLIFDIFLKGINQSAFQMQNLTTRFSTWYNSEPQHKYRSIPMADMADRQSDDRKYVSSNFEPAITTHTDAALPDDVADPVYSAKARLLNDAIQDIGMGRYQWQLFVVIGFGWAADNMWPIITSLILVPVTNEFNVSRPPLLSLAQNIGLLFGAVFWGFGCDVFGRRFVDCPHIQRSFT